MKFNSNKIKIIKFIVLLIISSLFSLSSKSQHCIFDVYSIIVVKAHSANDSLNIPDLKISVIDSKNAFKESNISNKEKDTITFFQNPNKSKFEHIANHKQYNFPFAKDNYCFVCNNSFNTTNYCLKIEDIDGPANGGEFKTAILKMYEIDKYPLCGRYDKQEYKELNHSNLGRVYKPIEVILLKKE